MTMTPIDDQAKQIVEEGVSTLCIQQWLYDNVLVKKRAENPDGELEIKVRGMLCEFRGDRARCVKILEQALKALKHPS